MCHSKRSMVQMSHDRRVMQRSFGANQSSAKPYANQTQVDGYMVAKLALNPTQGAKNTVAKSDAAVRTQLPFLERINSPQMLTGPTSTMCRSTCADGTGLRHWERCYRNLGSRLWFLRFTSLENLRDIGQVSDRSIEYEIRGRSVHPRSAPLQGYSLHPESDQH